MPVILDPELVPLLTWELSGLQEGWAKGKVSGQGHVPTWTSLVGA